MVMTPKDIEVARRLALADALKTIRSALHELGARGLSPIDEAIALLAMSDTEWNKTRDRASR